MASSVQFGRKAEIIVGNKSFSMDDFTLEFETIFDDDSEPNTGGAKIYNLSEKTIAEFTKGSQVIINAGYQSDVGTIFVGSIDEIKSYKDGIDKVAELTIGDGTTAWANTYVNKSYTAGIKASQVVNDILGLFNLEIGSFSLVNDVVYKSGKIVAGQLQNVLKQIVVNDCQSKFTITNGVITINATDSTVQTGFLLNANTGLIDSPERLNDDGIEGYTVKCLLNHRLITDSLIQIQSLTANGNFRVKKGKHTGSNTGDFITEIEVVPI